MSFRLRCPFLGLLLGIVSALLCLCPATAEAQRLRRFIRNRLAVAPPIVRIEGAPYEGVVVQTPSLAERISLRRRALLFGVQSLQAPEVAGSGLVLQAASQTPPRLLPTAADLAALDDATLLNTSRDIGAVLHQQLGRLSTAAGWQRHLGVQPELLGMHGIAPDEKQIAWWKTLLGRFDKVSSNPEYGKIIGQSGFVANHAALQEIVSRFAGPRLVDPAGGKVQQAQAVVEVDRAEESEVDSDLGAELLPAPTLAEEPEATSGERSILKLR
ncbi:MAG: hypothetical protein MK171_04130 [Pirellulales bacterium]|nr:hypothetical protein [Pirellulales bacterium]